MTIFNTDPAMTGMAMRNEKVVAASWRRPVSNPLAMVLPEREYPALVPLPERLQS